MEKFQQQIQHNLIFSLFIQLWKLKICGKIAWVIDHLHLKNTFTCILLISAMQNISRDYHTVFLAKILIISMDLTCAVHQQQQQQGCPEDQSWLVHVHLAADWQSYDFESKLHSLSVKSECFGFPVNTAGQKASMPVW